MARSEHRRWFSRRAAAASAGRDERRLDSPKGMPAPFGRIPSGNDRMGRLSEAFARGMGTPWFLVGMSVFVIVWLVYNTVAPIDVQFDPRALNFTLLTLILSLQASYAAPMILLAQNRQDDRDRVQIEQDRQRAERNLDDIEYLAREVVALRLMMRDVPTKEFLRSELRALRDQLNHRDDENAAQAEAAAADDLARNAREQ